MSDKSYRSNADIRQMGDRKPVLDRLEYRNESEYLDAQKRLHEYTFSKPADNCELCGYPMDYKGHKTTDWEEKWSVHEYCRDKMHGMLDRETGIARERRSFGRGKSRDRRR